MTHDDEQRATVGADLAQRLLSIDRVLTAHGFAPLSPWWRARLVAFLRSGKRQLVVRVGRRGGKSSSLIRLLVVLAIWGQHAIPAGDVGVVAIVSVNKDEAAQRLRTVRSILDALKIEYSPLDGGGGVECVAASGAPIAFKVYAATIAGVSGMTCVGILCDEVAKWRDKDGNANPATEVLASLRPTMSTQPQARIVLASSPWGTDDAHAVAFERGDDETQQVAHAPTWIANPTITEDETRRDEPDPHRHAREYGAIPGVADSAFLSAEELARAIRQGVRVVAPPPAHVPVFAAADLAFTKNSSTLALAWLDQRSPPAGHPGPDSKPRLVVGLVREWRPLPGIALEPEEVFADMARACGPYRVRRVLSDQWSFASNRALARQAGLSLEQQTAEDRSEMYEALAKYIRPAAATLPDDPMVLRDLKALRLRINPSGGPRVELPRQEGGGRHFDTAPAIALAALQADRRGPVTQQDDYWRGIAERQAGQALGLGGADFYGIGSGTPDVDGYTAPERHDFTSAAEMLRAA